MYTIAQLEEMAGIRGVLRPDGYNDEAFQKWAAIELMAKGHTEVAGEVCVGKPEAQWDDNDRKVVLGLVVFSRGSFGCLRRAEKSENSQ